MNNHENFSNYIKDKIVIIVGPSPSALKNTKENEAYKRLLTSTSEDLKILKTASVIQFSPKLYTKTIIINAGLKHNINNNLAVVNERDGMGDELVPDYFSQVEKGDFFGWPFFYLGQNEQPNLEKNYEQIKNTSVKKPDVLFKSHSGPIDLIFYNKKQFPKEFHGNAFVALHGSWNSSKPTGYMVVRIPFKNNKQC